MMRVPLRYLRLNPGRARLSNVGCGVDAGVDNAGSGLDPRPGDLLTKGLDPEPEAGSEANKASDAAVGFEEDMRPLKWEEIPDADLEAREELEVDRGVDLEADPNDPELLDVWEDEVMRSKAAASCSSEGSDATLGRVITFGCTLAVSACEEGSGQTSRALAGCEHRAA